MKKLYKILLSGILLSFTFLGCQEDFLELSDPNHLTEDKMMNEEGLKKMEIGMFAVFKGNYDYFYPLYLSHLPYEYVFFFPGGEGPYHLEWSDLRPTPNNVFSMWLYSGIYQTIFIANTIITNVNNNTGELGEVPEDVRNKILGSAYFMRGLCYFQLLHIWGKPHEPDDKWGVVLVTEPVKDRANLQRVRSKPSVVYDQIEADFKAAKAILPLEKDVPDEELGRPTRGAATAFLGKTYVFREKWDEAIQEFETFFTENPGKKLLEYYGDNFHGEYENGVESVFEVQYSDLTVDISWGGGGSGRPFQEYVGHIQIGRGNVGIPPVIIDQYEKGDIRKIETCFSEETDTFYTPQGDMWVHADTVAPRGNIKPYERTDEVEYGVKKYINKDRTGANVLGIGEYQCYENENIMRVAEVYLLYAEALAESGGNLNTAIEYLNKVRRRAFGYPENTPSPFDYSGSEKADFIDFLRAERGKEFVGEQIRWFDIMRWGIVEEEVAKTGRIFEVGVHEAMPIPREELETNLLCEQNPGY